MQLVFAIRHIKICGRLIEAFSIHNYCITSGTNNSAFDLFIITFNARTKCLHYKHSE